MIQALGDSSSQIPEIKVENSYKSVCILINSVSLFQIWKETQPELLWYCENNFKANHINISISGESNILLELNIPLYSVSDLETEISNGTLISKIDSIHGLPPKSKKSKILKSVFGLAVERKLTNISDLESRLIQLELKERAQSIDIKALVQDLSNFQIHFFKKLSELEAKVDLNLNNLDNKLGGSNASFVFDKDESWIQLNETLQVESKDVNQELTSEFIKILSNIDGIDSTVDYTSLESIMDFGNLLKTDPGQVLVCLREAGKVFKKEFRMVNYPVITPLKEIKANVIGQFVAIQGSVIRVSQVLPKVHSMNFICVKCGACTLQEFKDGKFNTPLKCCTFGCKGRVLVPDRSNSTVTIDWQKIKIQEKLYLENAESGQVPRTIDVELTGDLVDSIIPGDVATITGIVKVLSKEQGNFKSIGNQLYQLYIDVHSISKAKETIENDENEIKDNISFSVKDLYGIREIKQSGLDTIKLLVNSFCPKIFGQELVKLGLLLVLFGGRNREDSTHGVSIRSQPHILIVGDPGLGKSQLLSQTVKVAPRGVYVYGDTATAAGLTVNVCKDPDSGDMALEAGALVLGDQGICCIDEFDKMNDFSVLLEAMEQQSISIAKAGASCTLPVRTSVIAAANPVGGHYNKAKTVSENLKMSGPILSRFDLVFILLDKPDPNRDRFLSEHIMQMLHYGKSTAAVNYPNENLADGGIPENIEQRLLSHPGEDLDLIPSSLLRKYIAYARRYCQPRLSPEAAEILKSFYLTLRRDHSSNDGVPITTRQLESLIRLSEARARSELRNIVSSQDALDVIYIMKSCLWQAYQDEKGTIDFSRSQHGAGMSKKGDPKRFMTHLSKLASESGVFIFSTNQLKDIATQLGIKRDKFTSFIDSLNTHGYLLKNGPNSYKVVNYY